MKKHLLALGFLCFLTGLVAQPPLEDDCNKLGAWLWYIEITGFDTHALLADSLAQMGVKRVYVKVSDGTVNTNVWPELENIELVNTYKNAGLEVWAWSYNYPTSNDSLQALALYKAAETGYQGFVSDVEMEFDGDSSNLADLFTAFQIAKNKAKNENLIDDNFKLYCTTWGNPMDHDFRIDVIDPFVDGFMPQTYVEIWGQTYIDNLANWINVGNEEYASLGATKPIHHICATESGAGISAAKINEFISVSGAETSLWRIPGGAVPQSVWNKWSDVNWNYDFCTATYQLNNTPILAMPNPFSTRLVLEQLPLEGQLRIFNIQGQLVHNQYITHSALQLNTQEWPSGMYSINIISNGKSIVQKIIKE